MKTYPSLKLFDPRSFYNAWIYAILNILLGVYFLYNRSAVHSNIVYGFLSYQMWGFVWIVSGLALFYFLIQNNWKAIKHAMTIYLFFKAFWAIALIFYSANHGLIETLGSLSIWMALFALQIVTCIYFIDYRTLGGPRSGHA